MLVRLPNSDEYIIATCWECGKPLSQHDSMFQLCAKYQLAQHKILELEREIKKLKEAQDANTNTDRE